MPVIFLFLSQVQYWACFWVLSALTDKNLLNPLNDRARLWKIEKTLLDSCLFQGFLSVAYVNKYIFVDIILLIVVKIEGPVRELYVLDVVDIWSLLLCLLFYTFNYLNNVLHLIILFIIELLDVLYQIGCLVLLYLVFKLFVVIYYMHPDVARNHFNILVVILGIDCLI